MTLKRKNIRLENYIFRAVLKSLRAREQGESARLANSWAYITELLGYVGDGTGNHLDEEKVKKISEIISGSLEILSGATKYKGQLRYKRYGG